MTAAVKDVIVESQLADVEQISELHGWRFERIEPRRFRVTLTARTGDIYQVEVEHEGFPTLPPAFHWRNPETGRLDDPADSPKAYNFFHDSGRVCAPWNRLASDTGGPHPEWAHRGWQHNERTGATVTLAAMALRVYHELRSPEYKGKRG